VPRRIIRYAYRLLAFVLSLLALSGVPRLYLPVLAGPAGAPPGVQGQLTFLRDELDHGAGEQAQGLFPEGYFFLSALYGLTWVELGKRGVEPQRAVREARWALARLDTPAGRAPFSAELTPSYGVFYRGWTSWLRGGLLSMQPPERRDPAEVRRFVADCAELGAAFDASASPFLAAYPGQAWPVDSTVAVAVLRLHDTLFPARYAGTVARWLAGVRQRLDPATGLLPHRVDLATGTPTEVARASSQSIILRFLTDIDPGLARVQYLRFRERYLAWPLGLGPAIHEYPSDVSGPGDVDSGPLPLGVSLSATVVTIGAAQVQGDRTLAGALADYGELAGVPVWTWSTKRYVLGALPVGDAFLAWSKAAQPWVAVPPDPPPSVVPVWWRVPLVAIMGLFALLLWLPVLLRRRYPGGRTSSANTAR